MDKKHQLLMTMAQEIQRANKGSKLPKQRSPYHLKEFRIISGPRVGAIEVDAGFDAGQFLKSLQTNSGAVARQLVPWDFPGNHLHIYLQGKRIRLEAAWPSSDQDQDVKLSALQQGPNKNPKEIRWATGINELGVTVTVGFNDDTPHWLISGTSGSGKTSILRSMIYQIGHHPKAKMILIDGKYGEGLRIVDTAPNQVGPIVTSQDPQEAFLALSWAVSEMAERYSSGNLRPYPLVIIIDEFQEFTLEDSRFVEFIRKLCSQGRASGIHLVLATQQPTADIFKDRTIRANLAGRLALKTMSAEQSRSATGRSDPRADWLLGRGDCYIIVPSSVQRVQLAYVPEPVLQSAWDDHPPYLLEDWPDDRTDTEIFEGELSFPPEAVAIAIKAANQRLGRTRTSRLLRAAGLSFGTRRMKDLMTIGRSIAIHLGGYHETTTPID